MDDSTKLRIPRPQALHGVASDRPILLPIRFTAVGIQLAIVAVALAVPLPEPLLAAARLFLAL